VRRKRRGKKWVKKREKMDRLILFEEGRTAYDC